MLEWHKYCIPPSLFFLNLDWNCLKLIYLCTSDPNQSQDLDNCVKPKFDLNFELKGDSVKCASINLTRRWIATRCTDQTCRQCCWDINPVTSFQKITDQPHSVGITTLYRDKMVKCNDEWIAWKFSFNITMVCQKAIDSINKQTPPIQLSCDADAFD